MFGSIPALEEKFRVRTQKVIFEGVKKRYFNINIEKKSLFSKTTKAWDIVLVPLKRVAVGNKNVF
jgi:hypothetical protein